MKYIFDWFNIFFIGHMVLNLKHFFLKKIISCYSGTDPTAVWNDFKICRNNRYTWNIRILYLGSSRVKTGRMVAISKKKILKFKLNSKTRKQLQIERNRWKFGITGVIICTGNILWKFYNFLKYCQICQNWQFWHFFIKSS